ncbi:MAG: DUF975 family protein [Hungatella sp.]|nr:DUF975 family protein [Hungatella sp.]
MRVNRRELRARARGALRGNYSTAIGACLLFGVLAGLNRVVLTMCSLLYQTRSLLLEQESRPVVTETIRAVEILVFLVFCGVLIPGFQKMYLNICQKGKGSVGDIFWGFGEQFWRFLGLSLILVILGAVVHTPVAVLSAAMERGGAGEFPELFLSLYLPVIVLIGVWLCLDYCLLPFVLADRTELSLTEALEKSREMIRGNRMEFLILNFSFSGWYAAAFLFCGIGFLWLIPYVKCANLLFYLDLKEEGAISQE